MTKKKKAELQKLIEQATGKGWEDIAPCDIIKTIQMLGQLADDFFCK